jgi:tetratricopeptide (TPR) repeat protein
MMSQWKGKLAPPNRIYKLVKRCKSIIDKYLPIQKIKSMEFKYKVMAIIIFYILLLIYVILINRAEFSNTTVDSARYMLSALVQSEAAIIAVAISLSLVAVQLAASSYSARLIDLFKESYEFWIIIVSYIFSMAYQSTVLKLIRPIDSGSTFISPCLESQTIISYILSIIVFTLLVPHIWITLDLIKPSTIINNMARKIRTENILNASRPEAEDDPIEPVTSIIVRSLERHDEGTVIYGLNIISGKLINILNLDSLSDIQHDKIDEFILYHFSLIGRLAISSRDIYASFNVIAALKPIGNKLIDKKLAKSAINIIDIIADIGERSAENELGAVAEDASDALKDLGIKVTEHDNQLDNVAQYIVFSLRKIAIKSIKNELKSESSHVTTHLGAIGLAFARKSFSAASSEAASSLGRIASECAMHRERDTAIRAETYIHNIGVQAARNRLYSVVVQVAQSSEMIIENAAKYNFLEIVGRLVDAIEGIGEEFIIKLQPTTDEELYGGVSSEIIRNISRIVEILAKQDGFDKRQEILYKFAGDLGKYGQISAERHLASPASEAAVSFIKFGSLIDRETIRKYLRSILEASNDVNTCVQVARSFNELGNSFGDSDFHIEAEEAATKAISIDPNNAMAYLRLQHALAVQSIFLSNSGDKQNAQKKREAADKALAKHKELMGL